MWVISAGILVLNFPLFFRVEGRTWYTSHRGRLWIAATAKRPSPQEISELEATYRMLLRKGELLSLVLGMIWYTEPRNEQCQKSLSAEQGKLDIKLNFPALVLHGKDPDLEKAQKSVKIAVCVLVPQKVEVPGGEGRAPGDWKTPVVCGNMGSLKRCFFCCRYGISK